MELGVVFVIGVLALTAAGLFVYIISLRASLKEAARELDERLKTDTNTLISVSAGDRAVRALAARMNSQLRALSEERLRLRYGDAGLRTPSRIFLTTFARR